MEDQKWSYDGLEGHAEGAISAEETATLQCAAVGADIEPYMKPEEVKALQERLKDSMLKHKLAAFCGMKANYSQFGERDDDFTRYSAGWVSISNYEVIGAAAESSGWPDYISPPEFFDQALQAMEREGYGDSTTSGKVEVDG